MTKRRREFEFAPRAMSIDLAAWYVGQMEHTAFWAEMAAYGIEPILLRGNRIAWLREDLDAYLNHKAGRAPSGDHDDDAELSEEFRKRGRERGS